MNHSERIANLVRRARKSREWSQDDLAREAGVAPGTVGSVELGRNVRPGNLRAVLDALGIDPAVMDDTPTAATVAEDEDVQLVLDVIRKYLEGRPEGEERKAAVHALIRFTVEQ